MSTLINSLKSEIARVARKEFRQEFLALRKAATTHRSEIAALKRQVKGLASAIKASTKAKSKTMPAANEPTVPRIRFTAARFLAWRTKVGITQAQTATLVEASALSVFKWETDKAQPRAAQLQRIAAAMKMGKREVMRRLQEG